MKTFLKSRTLFALILIMILSLSSRAQTPNAYQCSVRNDSLLSSKIYEFDIYLLNNDPVNVFELASFQAGILVNPSIVNSGTITASIISGSSSSLVAAQQPSGITFASNCIKLAPRSGPGHGSGTIISRTSPGTRVCRIRLTNSVDFGQSSPNFSFNFTASPYNSVVSAYDQTTSLNTIITNSSNHTTATMINPVLNLPVTAFTMTGTGVYCNGGSGLAVGLSGSQTGVLYMLLKNSVASGSYIAGTGSSFSFGNQLFGTYTATAYRKGTNISNTMTGSAVVSISSPPSLTGDTIVCSRYTGKVYSVPGGMSSYTWYVSAGGTITAGGTSTSNSVTVTWNTVSPQKVSVVTISSGGCRDSVGIRITVNPSPVSAYTSVDTSECLRGNNFVFTNNSTVSSGSFTSLWKFGDNTTSTTTSPNHSFSSAGTFPVKLVVTSNLGCSDSLTKNYYVRPNPVAGFTSPDTSECLRGNNFVFTNTTSIVSGTFTNLWKFGDLATSTLLNPTHSYTTVGTFQVRLITTSNFGCKDSITKNYYTRPNPVAAYTSVDTSECLRGNNFAFTNNSTLSSGSFSSLWKFGDNTTSAVTSPTHSYTSAGTFPVRLVVTSTFGCKDSVTKNYYVRPNPVAGFTTPDTSECLRGNNFVFTNTTSIGSGTFTNLWKFGDLATSTLLNPTHSYTTVGTFLVRLIATSNFGCKDSITKNYYTRPNPVAAYTSVDTSECLRGNNFAFTNNSTLSSGSFSSLWKFGDNTTSVVTSPTHSYTSAGTFPVRLVVTSTFGCKDSVTKNYYVRPNPVAGFTSPDTSECLRGNNFVFTNTTSIGSGTFTNLWKFGDLATSTLLNPTHSYTTVGTFLVRLIATSNFGCKDSITKNYYTRPNPVAAYTSVDTSECLRGNNFAFTNNSTLSSGSFSSLWKFGDNTTSVVTSPTHSYTSAGTFPVRLVVTSNFGCKDSITKNYYVRPNPVAGFTTPDTSECLRGNNFVFTNTTSIGSGTFTNLWKFGDLATSTLLNPTHSYTTVGTFLVRLIATSNFGCKDSITKNYYTRPNPVAAYTSVDTSECLRGNNFAFTNNSTLSSGSFSNLWKFGDNTTSAVASPTHSFALAGTFPVRLVVTSNFGCKDSVTKNYYVRPNPVAGFTTLDTAELLAVNNFLFNNTTALASGTFTSLWKFGDASTSVLTSPSHSYSGDGIYPVKLIVTSNYGCKDSISKNYYVYEVFGKIVLLASNGITGIAGGQASYYSGGNWINTGIFNNGLTNASGIVYAYLPSGVPQFRMRYANTEAFAIMNAGVVNFQTCLAKVKILSSTGNKLSGGVISILGYSGWSVLGTTDTSGSVSAELLPGNYYYNAAYGISSFTTPTAQSVCTPYTFGLPNTKVYLKSSTGGKLAGGTIYCYLNGNWQLIGTTDTSGSVATQLLPGLYQFKVQYVGTQLITGSLDISNPIIFTTCNKKVYVLNSSGGGIQGDSVFYLGYNGWNFLGLSDVNGLANKELLPGNYYFQVFVGSTANTTSVPKSSCTIDTFKLNLAKFYLKSSTGAGLAGGSFYYWTGSWTFLGTTDTSGLASATLLPGNYSLMVQYAGTQIFPGYYNTSSPVTFNTCNMQVTLKTSGGAGIPNANVYYLGYNGWNVMPNTDVNGFSSKEILPGNYSLAIISSVGNFFPSASSCTPFVKIAPKIAAPDEDITINTEFKIYPNPVHNGNVNFDYTVGDESDVSIVIFDTKGTQVAEVLNSKESKGEHTINWNANELKSGVYYCRFMTNTVSKVKSLIIGN